MASVPFHYLELRAFSYATEHEQRVTDALALFVPEDVPIEHERTEGHHGDPITVFRATLESARHMRTVLEMIPGIPGFDRVLTDLEQRVDDETSFYLRFDKQRAFQGELALGDGVHLRGKIEAYPATREGAIENLRTALIDLRDEHHE